MPETNPIQPPPKAPLTTIDEINAEHDRLVERFQGEGGNREALCGEVIEFLHGVAAMGARLYSDSDRSSAQSLLSYWSNSLYRYDVPADRLPRGELAPYDPEAGADLRTAEFPFASPQTLDDASPAQRRAWSRLMTDALTILRANRLLVIIGAPGSGRSFLLQQGLWPRLARRGPVADDATAAPLRCLGVLAAGGSPLENLVGILAPTDDPRELAARVARLRAEPARFIQETAPASRDAVIGVDQFEEIFAFAAGPDVTAFLRALAAWVDLGQTAIVVGDADTLTRLAGRDEFTRWLNDAQLNVTFDANELREIVEEPAQRVGLIFEEGVIERLLRDVQGDPAALALLQFSLRRMWDERGGRLRNRISFEIYRQLGGGWVALQRAAERVYRQPGIARDAIKGLFMRLLTPHLGSGFSVTPVPLDFPGGAAAPEERLDEIVAEFCEAGLLRVIEPGQSEPRRVTVSHPALVRHWPRIVEWLDEKRVQMRGRLMLRNASEQWRESGEGSLFWRGSMLAEAFTYPQLNPVEHDFLAASQRAQRQRLLLKRAALTTIILLLAGWGGLMWRAGVVARQHALTVAREGGEKSFLLARTTVKEGTQAIAKGDLSLAALWFAESLREAESAVTEMKAHGVATLPQDETRRAAHRQRLSIALRQTPRLAHFVTQARLAAAEVTVEPTLRKDSALPDTRIVTVTSTFGEESGVAHLWDPQGNPHPLVSTPPRPANAVAFRPDGWIVAVGFGQSGGKDGAVQVWESAAGTDAGRVETLGAVRMVIFSPSRDRIAYWVEAPDGAAGEVAVWDRATGEIWAQPVPTRVNRIAFNPEGDRLAIALGDARKPEPGAALIWTFSAPRDESSTRLRIAHETTVNWVEFSPDGRSLVTASGLAGEASVGEARVWDAETGEPATPPLRHTARVAMAAFSPDGLRVATASNDGTARVWNIRNGRTLLTLSHEGWVFQARFSPDGRHLLTGSRDKAARVWDLATGRLLLPPLRHEGSVVSAAFAEDGRRVVASGGDVVRVWDLMTAMPPPPEFERPVSAATFSPDGERILTASGGDAKGTSIVELVSPSGEPIAPRLTMPGPVPCVAYSADGQRIAAGGGPSATAEVRVWKVGSAEGIGTPLTPGGEITALAFAPPDGRRLLVVSRAADGQSRMVTLWEPATGKITPLEHAHAVTFIAFSPDGTLAVTGSGDSIVRTGAARIFDAATGALRGELPHREAVTFASFDPPMQRLATAGIDDAAAIWDLSATPYRELLRIEKIHSADLTVARFSPDGQTLLTASYDSSAVLYDLARWSGEKAAATTRLPHGGVVLDAAFSADGSRVITGCADRRARVWDARTGELIAILPHQTEVRSAAFDAAGKRVLTLSFASIRPHYSTTRASGAVSRAPQLRLDEARLWNIAPDHLPTGDLRGRAELVTAATITGAALGPADLQKSPPQWQRLKTDYLAQVPRLPPGKFHQREAAFCEDSGRWFAAAWHLEATIRASGDDPLPAQLRRCGDAFQSSERWAEAEHYFNWTLLGVQPGEKLWAPTIALRARMRTELHRWEDAIKDCALMAAQDPLDHEPWTQLATIHLDQALDCSRRGRATDETRHWADCLQAVNQAAELALDDPGPWQRRAGLQLKLHPDDPAPYFKALEDMWAKFHGAGKFALRLAWPFVLDPRADVARLRELLPTIEKTAEADPNYFRLNTLGAVYLRVGDFAKARETLDRSRKTWAEVQVREALAQVTDESAASALMALEDGRQQDQIFLALTHHQLSREKRLSDGERAEHATEAQRWLRKALDTYDQIQQGQSREVGAPRRLWNELEFGILLKEATTLIDRPNISVANP